MEGGQNERKSAVTGNEDTALSLVFRENITDSDALFSDDSDHSALLFSARLDFIFPLIGFYQYIIHFTHILVFFLIQLLLFKYL